MEAGATERPTTLPTPVQDLPERPIDEDTQSQQSSMQSSCWNSSQETLLKGISERANCMRWLHNQCNIHFENLNFYFTIPNVVISTLNGSVTMSLTALFPDPDTQKVATTIIGLVSIFSAVLITMNQYVKSQQMMEAHRSSALAYGKLHRLITNELSLRRDQRSNALEFLKQVRQEQDRLENSSPTILPSVIRRFNRQFENRNIEKPEIAGDLDETAVNQEIRRSRSSRGPAVLLDAAQDVAASSPALRRIVSGVKSTFEAPKQLLAAASGIGRGFHGVRPKPRAGNPLGGGPQGAIAPARGDEQASEIYSPPSTPPAEGDAPLPGATAGAGVRPKGN